MVGNCLMNTIHTTQIQNTITHKTQLNRTNATNEISSKILKE